MLLLPRSSAYHQRPMHAAPLSLPSHSRLQQARWRPTPRPSCAARSAAASLSSGGHPFGSGCTRQHSSISSAVPPAPSFTPLRMSNSSACQFDALVPHARRRSAEGMETYNLSTGELLPPRRAGRSSSPRGRSGGRGGQGRGIMLSLEDCLAQVQLLHPTSKAEDVASAVYILGKKIDAEANKAQRPHTKGQRDAVVSATHQVIAALLRPSSPSSPAPLAMLLGSKDLSLVSWAVSILTLFDERAMSAEVPQLYCVLAERALQPKVMEANEREVYAWAQLLLGAGKVGERCNEVAEDDSVEELFTFAIEQRLPFLLTNTSKVCVAQDISNLALACVYIGFKGSMDPFMSGVAGRLGVLEEDPQAFSNVLLALAKLRWYEDGVVSKLADAARERVSSSVPQALSNNLWSLSTLGWYDRAVYDILLQGLVKSGEQLKPQDCSNGIYSCAMATHSGAVVDVLAGMVSKHGLSGWVSQAVSNALYSWAVLSSLGIASAGLNGMASALFTEANSRSPSAYKKQEINQLYNAHKEAERVGLQGGGLAATNGMQQAAAKEFKQYQAGLQEKKKQEGGSLAERCAVAALQQAGFEVELGGMIGEFFAPLLVRHESHLSSIAVDTVIPADLFRHPRGQLSGKTAAVHAEMRQMCKLVVLHEEEARQPGVVTGAVQREIAREAGQSGAAAGVSASSSAGVAGSTQPTATNHEASQAPGLLQPKARFPSPPGPRSAAPQLKGKPQRRM